MEKNLEYKIAFFVSEKKAFREVKFFLRTVGPLLSKFDFMGRIRMVNIYAEVKAILKLHLYPKVLRYTR